jgi:hypothetical protein
MALEDELDMDCYPRNVLLSNQYVFCSGLSSEGGVPAWTGDYGVCVLRSGFVYDQWLWTSFHFPSVRTYNSLEFKRASTVSAPLPTKLP